MSDINEIIIRHLDGSATEADKAQLLAWLKLSEENRKEYFEIRDLWLLNSSLSGDNLETELALNTLRDKILSTPVKRNRGWKTRLYTIMRAASILLLILSTGYLLLEKRELTNSETPVINRLLTADGSKGEFVLPDGTRVWLNANSMLEYPESFSQEERNVSLQGEAYFEVKRDEKKPFRVAAGDMNVEVLGTHFIVQNYNKRPIVEAILIEGKVRVNGSGIENGVVLSPNQRIVCSKQTNKTKVEEVDASNYISWIQDKLTFDNDPLADIITNMERWYGIEIKCPSNFAQTTRMSFTIRGESLDEILKTMALIAPIQYKREKDIVYISPQ